MFRVTTILATLTVSGAFVLTGCTQANLTASDAYKVGCPALDAVAASGSVVGKVALAGMQQLHDSGAVTGEAKQWVEVSIQFLSDPNKVSAEQKQQLKDGCAANGYTLKNV